MKKSNSGNLDFSSLFCCRLFIIIVMYSTHLYFPRYLQPSNIQRVISSSNHLFYTQHFCTTIIQRFTSLKYYTSSTVTVHYKKYRVDEMSFKEVCFEERPCWILVFWRKAVLNIGVLKKGRVEYWCFEER